MWPTILIFLAGKKVVSVLGKVDSVVSRSPLHWLRCSTQNKPKQKKEKNKNNNRIEMNYMSGSSSSAFDLRHLQNCVL